MVKNILTKEFLNKEYVANRKSTRTIGKMLGCAHVQVVKAMSRHGIDGRTKSESLEGNGLGRKASLESRKKQSISLKKYYETHIPISGMLGKKHSEVTRQKMSDAAIVKKNHRCGKRGSLSALGRVDFLIQGLLLTIRNGVYQYSKRMTSFVFTVVIPIELFMPTTLNHTKTIRSYVLIQIMA